MLRGMTARVTDASGERFASAGDLTLCYETFGSPSDPTMLLIMGMGFQLVHWPDAFCSTRWTCPPRTWSARPWAG